MDDTVSTPSGIDLNPDMMTTQVGVPTVVPRTAVSSVSAPGVIDITPGAPYSPPTQTSPQHIDIAEIPQNKIIDITPDGPISKSLISDETSPLQTKSPSPTYSHLSDIMPPSQVVDDLASVDLSQPLSEILQEVSSTPSSIQSNSLVQGIDSGVVNSPTSIQSTQSTPLTQSTLPDQPITVTASTDLPISPVEVEALATPVDTSEQQTTTSSVVTTIETQTAPEINPLYEDPDLVKIIK